MSGDELPNRRGPDRCIIELVKRMDTLTADHNTLRLQVDENTEITKRIDTNTAGLVEAWNALSGGLRVLRWFARVAKWITIIAGMVAAVSAAWYAFRSGTPVDIPKP